MTQLLSRRKFLAVSSALALPSSLTAADSPALKLSTFVEEVTCPIGHPCMGGGIRPATSIGDPLFVHGFVLQGAGKPIAYAAVDWCEIRSAAYDRWRSAIAEAIGTDRERVLVSALHQHDAPIADLEAQRLLNKYEALGSICNLGFHEKTVRQVAAAAKKSLALTHRVTHVGAGEARVEKVASNRRYIDVDGKVHYNRMSRTTDPKIRDADEGTIDPFLKALSFWNDDKALLVMYAYATHPMSHYGGGEVSADFVGLARKRMQAAHPDVFQFYVSGCSGNVTAGKYNDGAPGNRQVLADRIYKAMKDAFAATKRSRIEQVEFRTVPLKLEARSGTGFSEKELLDRLKEEPQDKLGFRQCLAALGLSWRKRVATGQPIDVPVIDFGGAAVLLLPAESYVEFQLAAQKARPDNFILVAGYGECGPGYIPIERAWDENDGNLSDWCWVEPGSEKKMRETIEKALKKQ
jgi:hypothetical protein